MKRIHESADFLYEGNELRGMFKQNGTLKLYLVKFGSLSRMLQTKANAIISLSDNEV